MADYPDSVFSPRDKENKSGVVYDADKKTVIFAEDIEKIDAEIVAIEEDLEEASRVRVYVSTSAQSIPSTTETKVEFDAESFDEQNEFDPVTNFRFTAKKAGFYHVKVCIYWNNNSDQAYYDLRLKKNGNIVSWNIHQAADSQGFSQVLTDYIELAVDDYLELFAFQSSGGAITIENSASQSYMTISKDPC